MEEVYMNQDGVQNLCAAIVKQAVVDYQAVLEKMAMAGERSGTARQKRQYKATIYQEIVSLQEFFHSDWFEMICDLDGQYVQMKVEENVKSEFRQKLQSAKERKTNAQKKIDEAGATTGLGGGSE